MSREYSWEGWLLFTFFFENFQSGSKISKISRGGEEMFGYHPWILLDLFWHEIPTICIILIISVLGTRIIAQNCILSYQHYLHKHTWMVYFRLLFFCLLPNRVNKKSCFYVDTGLSYGYSTCSWEQR